MGINLGPIGSIFGKRGRSITVEESAKLKSIWSKEAERNRWNAEVDAKKKARHARRIAEAAAKRNGEMPK